MLSVEEFQKIFSGAQREVRRLTTKGLVFRPNDRRRPNIFMRLISELFDLFNEDELVSEIHDLIIQRPHGVSMQVFC